LCDAFEVPKPLSPQLLLFGKSDDDLGELIFEVGRFSVLSVPALRTVRAVRIRPVFFMFLFAFRFDPSRF
jgi:hypothetical protein